MQSLILAGGKGTRLRPLTVYTPKPVVPLVNRPFLLYQIESLLRAKITDLILSLNYQPNKIENLLGDGSEFGVNLNYAVEPSPMGTAGAYKFAEEKIRETTVVFNGDVLTDVNIAEVVRFHRKNKALATIVLTPVENPSLYGLVETDEENRVLRFLEKPKPEELADLTTNNINAGIYILEPEVLDMIPEGEKYMFEYGVFPDLLKQKKDFYAYVLQDNYWRDIGNPNSYLEAHHDFLSGKIKLNLEKNKNPPGGFTSQNSIISEDCTIKTGAKIVNSVLGAGVHVEEKAVIENSVIWAHTHIESSVEIKDAVIGRGCYIGKNATIGAGAVLGDKTSLTDFTQI